MNAKLAPRVAATPVLSIFEGDDSGKSAFSSTTVKFGGVRRSRTHGPDESDRLITHKEGIPCHASGWEKR